MSSYSNKAQFLKDFRKFLSSQYTNGKMSDSQELFSHLNLVFVQGELVRVSVCHHALEFSQLKALFSCINSNLGSTIRELVLNSCGINDEMSNYIANELLNNASIQSIELFGNSISNGSLESWAKYIEKSPSLTRLKLGDNNISAEGMKILSEALARSTSVVQLHLGGNSIGDEGIEYLCNIIPEKNKSIVSLALRENNLTEKGMLSLCKMLMHKDCMISDIQLKGNSSIGTLGAKNLAPALAVNKSLKVLELHGANIGAEGATACCHNMINNVSIHAINFNQNDIGDSGAISVANLIQKGNISTLGLSENNISYKGTTALAHAFNFSNLTGIDLGGNSEIGNAGAIEIAKALMKNTTITSIDLRGCGIGVKGCIALAEMMAENRHLQHLDLGGNSCKNDGAEAFAIALSKNTTLKRLCLTDNLIMNRGGVALSNGLQKNVTLINLAYGGQGEKQNKISTPVRNIIDSIIKENKKIAKDYESITFESAEEREEWKSKILENSMNPNRKIDVQMVLDRYKEERKSGGIPHWMQSCPRCSFSDSEIHSMLIHLFKTNLIPRKDSKYPNYVYLTDLLYSLHEHFPETKGHISSLQLLNFVFKRQQFYVHLPPNTTPQSLSMVQIKYLQESPRKISMTSPQTPDRLGKKERYDRLGRSEKTTSPERMQKNIGRIRNSDHSFSSGNFSVDNHDVSDHESGGVSSPKFQEFISRTSQELFPKYFGDENMLPEPNSSSFNEDYRNPGMQLANRQNSSYTHTNSSFIQNSQGMYNTIMMEYPSDGSRMPSYQNNYQNIMQNIHSRYGVDNENPKISHNQGITQTMQAPFVRIPFSQVNTNVTAGNQSKPTLNSFTSHKSMMPQNWIHEEPTGKENAMSEGFNIGPNARSGYLQNSNISKINTMSQMNMLNDQMYKRYGSIFGHGFESHYSSDDYRQQPNYSDIFKSKGSYVNEMGRGYDNENTSHTSDSRNIGYTMSNMGNTMGSETMPTHSNSRFSMESGSSSVFLDTTNFGSNTFHVPYPMNPLDSNGDTKNPSRFSQQESVWDENGSEQTYRLFPKTSQGLHEALRHIQH